MSLLVFAYWQLVFKNFRFAFNFMILIYFFVVFYTCNYISTGFAIFAFILFCYIFYTWNFIKKSKVSKLSILKKGRYFFFCFFGTVGFLSTYVFTKTLFPFMTSTFVLYIWYSYIFLVFFGWIQIKFYNKYSYISLIFLGIFIFNLCVVLLFEIKNFDVIAYTEAFSFSTTTEFYYIDQPRGWLNYVNKRLDLWSMRAPNFFSALFEMYDLNTRYMRLHYFGVSDIFFVFENTQIGAFLSFIFLLVTFYFSLQFIFFKYIFASFQYFFYFENRDSFAVKIFEYIYYTIILSCVCISLPFFCKGYIFELFPIRLNFPAILINSLSIHIQIGRAHV